MNAHSNKAANMYIKHYISINQLIAVNTHDMTHIHALSLVDDKRD